MLCASDLSGKADYIPAVFSKNGMHFAVLKLRSIGMRRGNVIRVRFGVDCLHIVVGQYDMLSQTVSLELTQITGNLHILIQTLVDCKNGQCIMLFIPDADRVKVWSLAIGFALINRSQNLCV